MSGEQEQVYTIKEVIQEIVTVSNHNAKSINLIGDSVKMLASRLEDVERVLLAMIQGINEAIESRGEHPEVPSPGQYL